MGHRRRRNKLHRAVEKHTADGGFGVWECTYLYVVVLIVRDFIDCNVMSYPSALNPLNNRTMKCRVLSTVTMTFI